MTRTNEDIFDEIARANETSRYTGDRQEIISLRDLGRRYVLYSLGWPQTKPGTPETYVDIASSSALNAFASYREGRDFIGIFKGVNELLRSLFYMLLSQQDTFLEVGNPALETPPAPWSELPRDTAYMGTPLDPPQDEERRYFAERLTQFAYEFLIAHEMAHVRHGHTRLNIASPNMEVIEIDDTSLAGVSEAEGILKQTLEMDADAFATAQGMDNILHWSEQDNRLGELLRNKDKAMEYWLWSVYSLFRLFAPTPINLNQLSTATHPPARVRQMWMIQTALTRCKYGACPYDYVRFCEIAFRVAPLLDNYLARIAPSDPDKNTLLTAQDPTVDEHLARLHTKWCELRPLLEPICYVTNLTPCTP